MVDSKSTWLATDIGVYVVKIHLTKALLRMWELVHQLAHRINKNSLSHYIYEAQQIG